MGDDESESLPVASGRSRASRLLAGRRVRPEVRRLEFERALFRVTELQRRIPPLVRMPGPEPGVLKPSTTHLLSASKDAALSLFSMGYFRDWSLSAASRLSSRESPSCQGAGSMSKIVRSRSKFKREFAGRVARVANSSVVIGITRCAASGMPRARNPCTIASANPCQLVSPAEARCTTLPDLATKLRDEALPPHR